MKAFIGQGVAVLACMTIFSLAGAQTSPEGKSAAGGLPREACRALETYVAAVDAVKAQPDPAKRAERYGEAKTQLESVMKSFGKASVVEEAVLYATYTEVIVTKDATDAQLSDTMEKRLKMRAHLLGMCDDFTTTR